MENNPISMIIYAGSAGGGVLNQMTLEQHFYLIYDDHAQSIGAVELVIHF